MAHSYTLKASLARAAGHTAMALAALTMVTPASAQDRGEHGNWRGGQERARPAAQGRSERPPEVQRPQAPPRAPEQAPARVDNRGDGGRAQRPDGQPNWRGQRDQNDAARQAQRDAYRNMVRQGQGDPRWNGRPAGQPARPDMPNRVVTDRGQVQPGQGWRYGQRDGAPGVGRDDRSNGQQRDWRNERGDDRGPDRDRDGRPGVDGRAAEQWRNSGDNRPSWQGNNRPGWQNGQRNDAWRGNDRGNDRRGAGWQNNGRDNRQWDRGWRSNNRYDWSSYRSRNREIYRAGRYNAPYASYRYSRIGIGFTLGSLYYGQNYWISDPWQYRLPEVYGPYRWVRYYNDVVLVDIYSGEVVDTIYDFFW